MITNPAPQENNFFFKNPQTQRNSGPSINCYVFPYKRNIKILFETNFTIIIIYMHLLCIKKIFLEFFLFAIIEKYHNNTIENSSQIDKYNYVQKKSFLSAILHCLYTYMICLLASSLGPSGGRVGKGLDSMKITFIPLTPPHTYLPCQ